MVCVAIYGVIDFHELFLLIRLRLWLDTALWVIIFVVTFLLGVDNSILIALGGCVMLLVRRCGNRIEFASKLSTVNVVVSFYGFDSTVRDVISVSL
jgi:MFS superfamily sulfate permease-like transporter